MPSFSSSAAEYFYFKKIVQFRVQMYNIQHAVFTILFLCIAFAVSSCLCMCLLDICLTIPHETTLLMMMWRSIRRWCLCTIFWIVSRSMSYGRQWTRNPRIVWWRARNDCIFYKTFRECISLSSSSERDLEKMA